MKPLPSNSAGIPLGLLWKSFNHKT
jgi:hypothetical protein